MLNKILHKICFKKDFVKSIWKFNCSNKHLAVILPTIRNKNKYPGLNLEVTLGWQDTL